MFGITFRLFGPHMPNIANIPNRTIVAKELEARRIVIVLNTDSVKNAEQLFNTVSAIHKAGFMAEATMRIDQGIIAEAMPALQKLRSEELAAGRNLILAMGSITCDAELMLAAKWGCNMLVGPANMVSKGTNPDVVLKRMQNNGFFLAPAISVYNPQGFQDLLTGSFSPDTIKIFPAVSASAIKTLLAPNDRKHRHGIRLMPTGGVTVESAWEMVTVMEKAGFFPLLGMSSPLEEVVKKHAQGNPDAIQAALLYFRQQFLINSKGQPFGAIQPT